MRAGGEKRGNSYDRKARKLWMLATFGDGFKVACVHCRAMLTYEEVEADRIIPGGSYRHSNVQPACRGCNLARSNDATWTYAAQREDDSNAAPECPTAPAMGN